MKLSRVIWLSLEADKGKPSIQSSAAIGFKAMLWFAARRSCPGQSYFMKNFDAFK